MAYQLASMETKLLLMHFGNGFFRPPQGSGGDEVVRVPAYHLYRNLLAETLGPGNRLAIPNRDQIFYIHPDTILYVQNRNHQAELSWRITGQAVPSERGGAEGPCVKEQ